MRAPTASLSRRSFLQSSGVAIGATLLDSPPLSAQEATPVTGSRPRARDLGVPFLGGDPGPLNAITDVPGVGVGQVTIISGDGPLSAGNGPVRAGVTAIVPRLDKALDPVFAGRHVLNGNGEMTGSLWIDEMGMFYGPILLTGTYSVGTVKDAIQDIAFDNFQTEFGVAVVAETYDGLLNDAHGHHITAEQVFQAYTRASEWTRRRGECRRRHTDVMLRFQGRNRHGFPGDPIS